MNTNRKTLVTLSAVVWFTGVIFLTIKSASLLLTSYKNGVELFLILHAVSGGIVIGIIKAKYLFSEICKKNINRINSLKEPKLWQFYRKRFFIFLFLMILSGKLLANVLQNSNGGLLGLAVVEISVAVALLFSSYCFWERPDTRMES